MTAVATAPFGERFERARAAMTDLDVDVLLLSVGPDLPWLCGYEAMPLERLTMLVVPRDGDATLVVPALEAPRVVERPEFRVEPWGETDDPIDLVAGLVGAAGCAAIGDRTWARFLVDLSVALPAARFVRATTVTGPLRAIKDAHEIDMLRRAGAAVDVIAGELQRGEIELVGRTEAEVSAELGRRIRAAGHARVNFAIVAAGANAASPHHEAGARVIRPGHGVLCDFGGTMLDEWGVGYCSDITRCVWIGDPPADAVDAYAVLVRAQAAGVAAGVEGVACQEVDRAARRVIVEGGYGPMFIHRTGHGIGVEEHEDPYMVEGNDEVLRAGHAFSVEPGIYATGRFGFRLEDCVVATIDGPSPLNGADHELAVLA